MGWGSKYYIENHPALLDQPGEWWYDRESRKLYFWSPGGENPQNLKLEISRRDIGFDLSNTSDIMLVGLQIELFNNNGYQIIGDNNNNGAHRNQIINSQIRFVDKGIFLKQFVSGIDDQIAITRFLVENCIFSYIDSRAIDSYFSWDGIPSPENFTYAGIRETVIRNNLFHHIGYFSHERSAVGIRFFYPDQLVFEGNHIHHIAHNGMQLHLSLVDSTKIYDLDSDEIKLGEILIKDNLFEKTCQAGSDCGGLKIGGSARPYSHVFRDVLIVGNTFRHIFGWGYVSVLRNKNIYGDGNGFYLDYASGVHAYRNISYNNSGAGFKLACLWRDGEAVFYNNIAAGNYLYGFRATGKGSCDEHNGSVNSQFVNNIITNNGRSAIEFYTAYKNSYGNLVIDHNLYFQNGWDKNVNGNDENIIVYREGFSTLNLGKLSAIHKKTGWETNGIIVDPKLEESFSKQNYLYQYYNWQFDSILAGSPLLDSGSGEIPESLSRLLQKYQIESIRCGSAYDIGPNEFCDTVHP